MANGLTVSALSRFEFQVGNLNLRATSTNDVKGSLFFHISYQNYQQRQQLLGTFLGKKSS